MTGTLVANNTNGQDIEFSGKELGRVSSYRNDSVRWTELVLFAVDVGGEYTYIAQSIGRSTADGEADIYQSTPCRDITEVIDVLGMKWLAKKLYDVLDFNTKVKV